jgi:elongation factor G
MKPVDIRNLVILGNSATGKTTLTDLLAFQAKASPRLGKVSDGSSISDYQPDEIEKKISIYTSLVGFEYKGKRINCLDTPGFQDFIGEPLSAIRAADVGLCVLVPDQPVPFAVKRFVKECRKNSLGVAFFVNKMDKEGADFGAALENIKGYLKTGVAPVAIPAGSGASFKGVVDVLNMKFYAPAGGPENETEIPADLKGLADEYRKKMIEAVAECDDKLLEKYFETESLTEEEIQHGFVEGLESGKLSLVFAGAADKCSGASALLDTLINDMPSPADRPPVAAKDGDKDITINPDPAAPFSAFVFKTSLEPHMGDMNFVRVFSGTVKSGMDVHNSSKNSTERVGQIFLLTGKERKEVKEVSAGEICVMVKLKDTQTGHTLCDAKAAVQFPPISFPKPVMDVAIMAKDKADEDKLGTGLHKILLQDPTLRMRMDPELKQTILSGVGEQQMESVKRQLKNKFNVNIEFERPRVAYRETIKKPAKAQGRHKKQTGGHGQYGDCWLELSPLPLNHPVDFEFEDNIVGGKIPSKYIPAVEKGVKDSMSRGIISGNKVIKVKVGVFDGSYHDVDSSDLAFQIAGSLGFKNAAELAAPVILEPINKVRIFVADAYLGDVMGDLNGRRGKIIGMDDDEDMKVVQAFVPDSEMYKYSNDLRSMTQGTGNFEMEFDHYLEVPHDVSAKIVEHYQKTRQKEAES